MSRGPTCRRARDSTRAPRPTGWRMPAALDFCESLIHIQGHTARVGRPRRGGHFQGTPVPPFHPVGKESTHEVLRSPPRPHGARNQQRHRRTRGFGRQDARRLGCAGQSDPTRRQRADDREAGRRVRRDRVRRNRGGEVDGREQRIRSDPKGPGGLPGRDRGQPNAGANRHRLQGQAGHPLSQRQPSTPTTPRAARSSSAATAWS